jgi:NAD-dependent DNA ligase
MATREEEIKRKPEIGPEVAKSILLFFEQAITKDLLDKLERAGIGYEKKEARVAEEAGVKKN